MRVEHMITAHLKKIHGREDGNIYIERRASDAPPSESSRQAKSENTRDWHSRKGGVGENSSSGI